MVLPVLLEMLGASRFCLLGDPAGISRGSARREQVRTATPFQLTFNRACAIGLQDLDVRYARTQDHSFGAEARNPVAPSLLSAQEPLPLFGGAVGIRRRELDSVDLDEHAASIQREASLNHQADRTQPRRSAAQFSAIEVGYR